MDDTAIITMRQVDNSGVSYIEIGKGTVTSAGWTKVEGNFTLKASIPLTKLVLYFEGPDAGVNFYMDDVVLQRPVR